MTLIGTTIAKPIHLSRALPFHSVHHQPKSSAPQFGFSKSHSGIALPGACAPDHPKTAGSACVVTIGVGARPAVAVPHALQNCSPPVNACPQAPQ